MSPTVKRRHGFEKFSLAVENSDPSRSVDFVTRKGVEIAIQLPDIHLHVRHSLRAIDQHRDSIPVTHANNLPDRIDRTQSVRIVRHATQLPARRQESLEFIQKQPDSMIDRSHAQCGTKLANDLPGDNI